MERIVFKTEHGTRWFNKETATFFKEGTYNDGRNWISKATGSQFFHQWLIQTASGVFILNNFNDYQGSKESYDIISKEAAAEWLLINEYEETALLIDKETVANLEI